MTLPLVISVELGGAWGSVRLNHLWCWRVVAPNLTSIRISCAHISSLTDTYAHIRPLWGCGGRLACCVQVAAGSTSLLSVDLYPLFPHLLFASSIHPSISLPPEQNAKGPSAFRGPVASTKSLGPDVWSWPCVSLSMADLALAHWWTTSQLSLGDVVHGC